LLPNVVILSPVVVIIIGLMIAIITIIPSLCQEILSCVLSPSSECFCW
jgi:hypothetical protein